MNGSGRVEEEEARGRTARRGLCPGRRVCGRRSVKTCDKILSGVVFGGQGPQSVRSGKCRMSVGVNLCNESVPKKVCNSHASDAFSMTSEREVSRSDVRLYCRCKEMYLLGETTLK